MEKNKAIITGFIFSFIFIIVILYFVDFKAVIEVLYRFSIKYIFILFLIYMIGMLLRSARWSIIINQESAVKFKDIFSSLALGYMSNNILPAKMGELVRIIYINRIYKNSKSYLLGAVIVERLFDILIISVFLFISIFFSNTIQHLMGYRRIPVLIFFVILICFCFFIMKSRLINIIIDFFPERLSLKLQQIFTSFSKSFYIINSQYALLKVLLLSTFIWLLTCAMSYTILHGLNITIPFYAYFFVVSAGVLGMIIPSTSGSIGVYHAVSMSSLLLFGVDKDIALTYALISHASDFIPNSILGCIVLIKDNFSLTLFSDEKELV